MYWFLKKYPPQEKDLANLVTNYLIINGVEGKVKIDTSKAVIVITVLLDDVLYNENEITNELIILLNKTCNLYSYFVDVVPIDEFD